MDPSTATSGVYVSQSTPGLGTAYATGEKGVPGLCKQAEAGSVPALGGEIQGWSLLSTIQTTKATQVAAKNLVCRLSDLALEPAL